MLMCVATRFTARNGCFRVLSHPVSQRSEIKTGVCVVCVCVYLSNQVTRKGKLGTSGGCQKEQKNRSQGEVSRFSNVQPRRSPKSAPTGLEPSVGDPGREDQPDTRGMPVGL